MTKLSSLSSVQMLLILSLLCFAEISAATCESALGDETARPATVAKKRAKAKTKKSPPADPTPEPAVVEPSRPAVNPAQAPARPTPEYFAFRAVPSLFEPDLFPPPTPANRYPSGRGPDHMGYNYAAAQDVLDRAIVARSDRGAAVVDKMRRLEVFPKILISVHMLPKLQATAADWIREDPELRDLPKVALVTSTPSFNIPDPDFERVMDAFLFSDGGECRVLGAAEAYVIGGFEEACLANSLFDLLRISEKGGLNEITVHIKVKGTYSRYERSYEKLLRDPSIDTKTAMQWLHWFHSALAPVPGTFERSFENGPRIRVTLMDRDLVEMRGHARTHARMNLIIEW